VFVCQDYSFRYSSIMQHRQRPSRKVRELILHVKTRISIYLNSNGRNIQALTRESGSLFYTRSI